MEHTIAGLVRIEKREQPLSVDDEKVLNAHLDVLLERIGAFTDVNGAGNDLNQLGQFQTDLATACFKWKVHLPPRLRDFVRQFDRSDDPKIRLIVFESIRSKQFCAEAESKGPGPNGTTLRNSTDKPMR